MTELHGPNVIEANGTTLLLTTTGGGVAVHLTASSDDPSVGREAVFDFYFDRDQDVSVGTLASYDRASLVEPRWSPTTVCGREWAVMAGGDGGAVSRFGEVAFAPTCRRCLALIDRHFPKPIRDSRLTLVARLAADFVVDQRGYVEVHGVPGDQQDELRRTIRALIRDRTSHSVRTYVINEVIYVECREIHRERAEKYMPEITAVLNAAFTGDPSPRLERDWVISWAAWDIV